MDPINQLRKHVWDQWAEDIGLRSPLPSADLGWFPYFLCTCIYLVICRLRIIKVLAPLLHHSSGEPKIQMTCESRLPISNHQIVNILALVVVDDDDTNAQTNFTAKETKTEEVKRSEL